MMHDYIFDKVLSLRNCRAVIIIVSITIAVKCLWQNSFVWNSENLSHSQLSVIQSIIPGLPNGIFSRIYRPHMPHTSKEVMIVSLGVPQESRIRAWVLRTLRLYQEAQRLPVAQHGLWW